MNNADELTLDLPNFTGPLDLLCTLIRSQKIDIYDIPIAKITGQYLANLARWQTLDLQIAGEYFVMASTLLRIKSQYLLPKMIFLKKISIKKTHVLSWLNSWCNIQSFKESQIILKSEMKKCQLQ